MRTPARIALLCLFALSAARANDLEAALSARSAALVGREDEAAEAREALLLAETGTSFSASVSPSLTLEQDLASARDVEFDAGFSLAGQVVYRFDARAIATARIGVLRAEARARAQHRTDVERALLALSALRLALRSLDDARASVEALDAGRSDAQAEGGDPLAEIEARTAALDLRQAEEAVRVQRQTLAGLGLEGPGSLEEIYLILRSSDPAGHPQAQLLRQQVAQARAGLRLSELAFVPTLALTGRYEESGVTTTARMALAAGRPEVSLGVGYRADDDRAWSVGVDATFRIRDSDLRGLAAAEAAVAEAERALEEFLASQGERERVSLNVAQIAEEAFAISLLTLELARQAAAGAVGEVETRRASQALRRADDAAERAWQRYVRAVADHLAITEGEWRVREVDER